ncbi:MAG: hypothetical protein M1814_000831 [Vezdaea aestivalis]|nr:MAG: hypothetical protein M1814_000831 [Vezdaea aestivalis]
MGSSTGNVNVFVSTFSGLGLPKTLCLPINRSKAINELISEISQQLPAIHSRLILTTSSNHLIKPSSAPISSLLPGKTNDISLRLSAPLCGGKGGFGSQLRAAGGRMSSKRKKNQGDSNGSSRNLDGRRLRTVAEAKALAEYLAVKPEMDRKEKEARRQRWEQVVELAERREAEIKSGSKGKVDGQWVEDKDEAGERTRDAVQLAMSRGGFKDNLFKPQPSTQTQSAPPTVLERTPSESSSNKNDRSEVNTSSKTTTGSHVLFGFDDDEEFMSDESESETEKK